jgi:hypothetical protein
MKDRVCDTICLRTISRVVSGVIRLLKQCLAATVVGVHIGGDTDVTVKLIAEADNCVCPVLIAILIIKNVCPLGLLDCSVFLLFDS